MRSVTEALNEILPAFPVLPSESVSLVAGLGRTLAEAVTATNALPPFDNSAMDGYALRTEDVESIPCRLRVIGDIPAGSNPEFTLTAGTAARIMTGAPLPAGANAVIPVEATDQPWGDAPLPAEVEIQKMVTGGAYIRRAGEDVQVGEAIFSAGQVLRPQDLGLLAGLGVAEIPVIRRPRVAILSTGDELLTPAEPLQAGKIRDMNGYSLYGMVAALGAEPLFLGIARDTLVEVRAKFLAAVEQGADVIISSAGVSVGTHDVVKTVLAELGAVGFWQVNMRPGKPLAYGQVQGVPFFGLPGNPVSSLASFEVFVRPALLSLLGQSGQVPTVQVRVGEAMTSDGRESYIRVRLEREAGQLVAYSTGTQSSGAISSLVKAAGLLIIPEGVTEVVQGDYLNVRPFAGQALIY